MVSVPQIWRNTIVVIARSIAHKSQFFHSLIPYLDSFAIIFFFFFLQSDNMLLKSVRKIRWKCLNSKSVIEKRRVK
ncbi:transmembrane protein, putative [Medicago truncatula]|uniref:Transmembrane protein, putative n=1 Tax=Medicago truncatula TaxID=3880 RepID=G7L0F2_MEDTR|nr:transmembrane protein, putative [Medicago truncatula]